MEVAACLARVTNPKAPISETMGFLKTKCFKRGFKEAFLEQKEIGHIGKTEQITPRGGPSRSGHAPVKDINKNIIHDKVPHRGNDHGHHGKFGFSLCPNDRIAHHTKAQERHSV